MVFIWLSDKITGDDTELNEYEVSTCAEYRYDDRAAETEAITASYTDVTGNTATRSTAQELSTEFDQRLPPPPTMPPPPPSPGDTQPTVGGLNFFLRRSNTLWSYYTNCSNFSQITDVGYKHIFGYSRFCSLML